MVRARARTAQNTLVVIPPSIPIQNTVILPHISVVTQFTSVFHKVTTVLPYVPVFPIGETAFPMAQINLTNDANTYPMVQVTIGQTDSQGKKLGKSYLRILFLFTTIIVI